MTWNSPFFCLSLISRTNKNRCWWLTGRMTENDFPCPTTEPVEMRFFCTRSITILCSDSKFFLRFDFSRSWLRDCSPEWVSWWHWIRRIFCDSYKTSLRSCVRLSCLEICSWSLKGTKSKRLEAPIKNGRQSSRDEIMPGFILHSYGEWKYQPNIEQRPSNVRDKSFTSCKSITVIRHLEFVISRL